MTTDLDLQQDCQANEILVNEDWCVLPDGLEHRASGYFIAHQSLAARRGDLWEWPLHMAEKSWCRPRLLREAFLVALDRFGIAPDAQLARSFAVGFGIRSGVDGATDGFVQLGEVVRPGSAKLARGTKGTGLAKGAGPAARQPGRRSVAA